MMHPAGATLLNLSTRSKLFLSHFLAIVLVSGSIGSYFYANAIENLLSSLKSRLLNSAALMSHSFDVAQLDTLRAAADTSTRPLRLKK